MIGFIKAINRQTAVDTIQNMLKQLKTVFVQYTIDKIALINIYLRGKFLEVWL